MESPTPFDLLRLTLSTIGNIVESKHYILQNNISNISNVKGGLVTGGLLSEGGFCPGGLLSMGLVTGWAFVGVGLCRSTKKNGLNCTAACKHCCGELCCNVAPQKQCEIVSDSEAEYDNFEDNDCTNVEAFWLDEEVVETSYMNE